MSAAAPARRQVSYESLDAVLADARRLVDANARTTGQWSLGQILQHLAMALNASVDGFGFTMPWPIRFVARNFVKKSVLANGMKPGIKLPARAAPALTPPDVDAPTAVENLARAIDHFQSATAYAPHPAFDQMTPDETKQLQLRHAELHMSFVRDPA